MDLSSMQSASIATVFTELQGLPERGNSTFKNEEDLLRGVGYIYLLQQ